MLQLVTYKFKADCIRDLTTLNFAKIDSYPRADIAKSFEGFHIYPHLYKLFQDLYRSLYTCPSHSILIKTLVLLVYIDLTSLQTTIEAATHNLLLLQPNYGYANSL